VLARSNPEILVRQRVGVRVNRVSGPDAAADFEALGRASRFVEFDSVVVTKVESGADVRQNLALLRSCGVACRSVVPIVETRPGLANLDDIVEESRRAGIKWLAYGHFDLALDSGWWPFPEPWDSEYWGQVEPLVHRWEAAGFGYIHPPTSKRATGKV
jgi:citrate lyase beta subunit